MKTTRFACVLAALALVVLSGCRKKGAPEAGGTTGAKADVTDPAAGSDDADRIVVTQKTQVVAEADVKSKHLAMMQPGETMVFLGDSATSPSGKNEQLYKVRLSDGTEGWARNYGLVMGKAGAILMDASLYERPTVLSPSRQKLAIGRLVGILEKQDEFVKVSASRWQTGWVEMRAISTESNDVLAAALVAGATGRKTGRDALQAGYAAISDRSCALAIAMKAKLDSLDGIGASGAEAKDSSTSKPDTSVKN